MEERNNSVSLEELQQALLVILKDIHNVCIKHNIKYSLGAGTALGAVRHHGFIPWDDDVDLVFLREEYEKFLTIAETELVPLGYYVQREFSKTWPMTYSKIRKNGTTYIEDFSTNIPGLHQGIFVDIFPVDNMFDSPLMHEVQWRAYQLVCAKGLMRRGYKTNSAMKRFAMYASRCFPEKNLVEICRADKHKNSKYVNIFLGGATGKNRNIHERHIFNEYILTPFEGCSFFIVKDYDTYLKKTYGDYMKLPPENERKSAIHAQYVNLEKSYENYIS